MGRTAKKKSRVFVETMLQEEAAIRRAVKEGREELRRYYPSSNADSEGGVKLPISDRTGNMALKLVSELESVFVIGVGTIPFSERWLACFDAVRDRANQCERPEILFHHWRIRFEERKKFVGEMLTGRLDYKQNPDGLIMWIIYWTEVEAVDRGLMTAEQCSLYMPEEPETLKTEILKTGEPQKI